LRKVALTTLGCKVNQYETEAIREIFVKEGYEVVPFESLADIYVINTCTVTNMGDKKSRHMILRAKKENKDAIIAVIGCYAQIAWEEICKIEGVNVILGTKNKSDILYYINKAIVEKKQQICIKEVLKDDKFENLNINDYSYKSRAFIKIQDGCNKFCSYCLIPYARGAVCSKEPESILKEAKELVSNGFKEIILSGIHTASYGIDFKIKYDLLDLLDDLEAIEGITRIRIGSMDPVFFTSNNIKRLSGFKKLCPHFHISLQSGCNATLARMNRHYTGDFFKELVENLRKSIKDISITTDVIVGFPGETKEEFNITYNLLKELQLSKMHIFKFSPRKGTKAQLMPNQVEPKLKDERSEILINLDKKLEETFINKFIGREFQVLFENNTHLEENLYCGYTPNYIKAVVSSKDNITHKIFFVKLIKNMADSAFGEIRN